VTAVRSGSATDVGRVRNKNEDLALENSSLFAVADGMGGHAGGEVAARVAVDTLQRTFEREPTAHGLLDAVVAANAAVWRASQGSRDLRGMGTTLTVAALVQNEDGQDVVVLANVGDSRAYVAADGQLVRVTADHSLAEERVRQGVMTEAEAAVHPHRHILTRALGIGPGVDVDLWELRLQEGDRLLLCSDGLTNEVDDDRLTELLAAHGDPSEAATALVAEANRRGGNDNITVVIVDVTRGESAGPLGEREAALAVPLPTGPGGTTGDAGSGSSGSGLEAPATHEAAPGGSTTAPAAGRGGVHDVTGAVPAYGGDPSGTSHVVTRRPPGRADRRAGNGRTSGVTGAVAAPDEGRPSGLIIRPGAPGTAETDRADGRDRYRDGEGRRGRGRGLPQPRRLTVRVGLFVILLLVVVAAAYFVVRWYAMDNYYVGIDHDELVVYQGRPGGLLGFQPKVVDRTGVNTSEVLAVRLPALRSDVSEPSLSAAKSYVNNLRQEDIDQQQLSTGQTPSGTTTTTGTSTATTTAPSTTTAPQTGAPAGSAPNGALP
jgi:PPM family protein phosphatase